MSNLFIAFCVFIIVLFLKLFQFIFQPYFNWKKQKKNQGGLKELQIKMHGKDYSFEDYKKET